MRSQNLWYMLCTELGWACYFPSPAAVHHQNAGTLFTLREQGNDWESNKETGVQE
jgi:hypothetical protein